MMLRLLFAIDRWQTTDSNDKSSRRGSLTVLFRRIFLFLGTVQPVPRAAGMPKTYSHLNLHCAPEQDYFLQMRLATDRHFDGVSESTVRMEVSSPVPSSPPHRQQHADDEQAHKPVAIVDGKELEGPSLVNALRIVGSRKEA